MLVISHSVNDRSTFSCQRTSSWPAATFSTSTSSSPSTSTAKIDATFPAALATVSSVKDSEASFSNHMIRPFP